MAASELTPDELEAHLGRLHEESFGWALSCCGWDYADAEDVLQAAYLRIVSGRARFGGRSTFRTWLFGVIRQTSREHHRHARSQRERGERLAREMDGASPAPPLTPDAAERAEARRILLEALDELPARQQEVLHLVFYQDLTIAEAAEVMEISLGAARVHYDRGKKRLRQLLSARDLGAGSL